MTNPLKTITPLLLRVIVFLCLFIIISGVIGPRVISSDIFFRDGFEIYGSVGKTLIFSAIAFVLLLRHNKSKITLHAWQPVLLWWAAASLGMFAVAWISIDNLLAGERHLYNLLGAHGGLQLCLVFAAVGCVGLKNMRLIWQQYRREITGALALGVLFYLFLLAVYALWQPLASVVLFSVNGLLGATGLPATILPPHTLMFDKFGITIAEFCSGIESIALFTSLYAIVGLLDWKKLNKRRYFLVFPIALLVLCLFNVLRVYGLIMAGYYINPQIAFSLFHTYAGMVFFILYSAIFWSVSYKYLLNKEKPESH